MNLGLETGVERLSPQLIILQRISLSSQAVPYLEVLLRGRKPTKSGQESQQAATFIVFLDAKWTALRQLLWSYISATRKGTGLSGSEGA